MTLLHTAVARELSRYEDAQFQAEAPIGTQRRIPAGIHNIELSWDRKKAYMRINISHPSFAFGIRSWWFKEYLGKAQLLGTDDLNGRLYLRAMAQINGETLTMWRDPNASPHELAEGTRRNNTHNRLCYRRAGHEWRLRDERLPWNHPDALVFASSYVGDLAAEWNHKDPVAHIYHNGWTVIDEDNVAHLYDPDLVYV
jgi:hypothetical protein